MKRRRRFHHPWCRCPEFNLPACPCGLGPVHCLPDEERKQWVVEASLKQSSWPTLKALAKCFVHFMPLSRTVTNYSATSRVFRPTFLEYSERNRRISEGPMKVRNRRRI